MLKTLCWGGPNIIPRQSWIKIGIMLHEVNKPFAKTFRMLNLAPFSQPEQLHAFGLLAIKGATKAFQLVLQAYILKHLMFEGKMAKKAAK